MTVKLFLPLAALALLGGCVQSPEYYETTPVQVATPKGVVTCQLYTREMVIWDRSIDRPARMSVQEADAICQAEGRREQAL
jgi:hypothetical protein